MNTAKALLLVAAIALTVAAYVPYVRDTLHGKTKPHLYSWLVGCSVATLSFIGQIIDKSAGLAAIATAMVAISCLMIVILSIRYGITKGTRLDKICLVTCAFLIGFWIFSGDNEISIILINLVNIIGFIPTVIKTYKLPQTETLISYELNIVRFTINIFALQTISIVSVTFPLTWLVCNIAFVLMTISRRKYLSRKASDQTNSN